jgi:hypothetical protein
MTQVLDKVLASDSGRQFGNNWGGIPNALLGGWQLGGITTAHTGEAFTAGLSSDYTNTGSPAPWPDAIHDPYDFSFNQTMQAQLGCTPGKQTLQCWFNQAAFAIPALAPGQKFAHLFGNATNGNLRGPNLVNFDFSLMKRFIILEKQSLEFRTEFFNILNHPNFALPGSRVDIAGGASITSTVTDNQREIQFALKWSF